MAHIRLIEPDDASGPLEDDHGAAITHAGVPERGPRET
jgi:hypothetical protein